MSRDLIIHMTDIAPNRTLVTGKIALFLSGLLGIEYVDRRASALEALRRDKYRNVFLINGPTGFCQFRDEIGELIARSQRCVWVQNDYLCYPPSQAKPAMRDKWPKINERSGWTRPSHVWSTIPERCTEPQDVYINWNELAYEVVGPGRLVKPNSKRGLFYYGAARDGRMEVLKKYLRSAKYPVTVSCSPRGAAKFQTIAHPDTTFIPTFHDFAVAAQYKATVYAEDERSNRLYTSPACRFYECLGAGLAQFVDEAAVHTLEHAKLPVYSSWVVGNDEDVERKLRNWKSIRDAQRDMWSHGYREHLEKVVKRAYEELNRWRGRG